MASKGTEEGASPPFPSLPSAHGMNDHVSCLLSVSYLKREREPAKPRQVITRDQCHVARGKRACAAAAAAVPMPAAAALLPEPLHYVQVHVLRNSNSTLETCRSTAVHSTLEF